MTIEYLTRCFSPRVCRQVAVKAHKPTGAALLPVYQEKGELFTKLKLLDQAFSYLDKAVDVCNRNYGPDDSRTATALVNVGKLHVMKGTFAESVFFYRSALRVRRQVRESHILALHITRPRQGWDFFTPYSQL